MLKFIFMSLLLQTAFFFGIKLNFKAKLTFRMLEFLKIHQKQITESK
jgi:hypothetical protein